MSGINFPLIDANAEAAIIRYQSRISNMLNTKELIERVLDSVELNVGYGEIEVLLCNTAARYELIPRKIEIEELEPPDDPVVLEKLAYINAVLSKLGHRADEREKAFDDFKDPTKPSDEETVSLSVLVRFFQGAPAAREKLRALLGIPPKLIKEKVHKAGEAQRPRTKEDILRQQVRARQATARRAAIGYFSYEMIARFKDHKPHDEIVVGLLKAASIITNADQDEMRYCRYAYTHRQGG